MMMIELDNNDGSVRVSVSVSVSWNSTPILVCIIKMRMILFVCLCLTSCFLASSRNQANCIGWFCNKQNDNINNQIVFCLVPRVHLFLLFSFWQAFNYNFTNETQRNHINSVFCSIWERNGNASRDIRLVARSVGRIIIWSSKLHAKRNKGPNKKAHVQLVHQQKHVICFCPCERATIETPKADLNFELQKGDTISCL